MTKRRRVSCPTPEKVGHRSLKIAKLAAREFARKHVSYEQVEPLFAYECRCEQWHLTHKEAGQFETVPVLTIPTELQEWARTKVTDD